MGPRRETQCLKHKSSFIKVNFKGENCAEQRLKVPMSSAISAPRGAALCVGGCPWTRLTEVHKYLVKEPINITYVTRPSVMGGSLVFLLCFIKGVLTILSAK